MKAYLFIGNLKNLFQQQQCEDLNIQKVWAVGNKEYCKLFYIIFAGCFCWKYFSTKPSYDNNRKNNMC